MKINYTPGPWRVSEDRRGIWIGPISTADKLADEVCEVKAMLSRHITPTDRANAQLISAAPELVEALQGLLSAPDLRLDGMEQETWEAIFKAKDALQKAGVTL